MAAQLIMLGACITTAGSLTFLAHHHEGPRIPQKSEEIVNTTQVPYSSDVPSGVAGSSHGLPVDDDRWKNITKNYGFGRAVVNGNIPTYVSVYRAEQKPVYRHEYKSEIKTGSKHEYNPDHKTNIKHFYRPVPAYL